jgi:hypothetical protein
MKAKWAAICVTALLAAAPFVYGQDSTGSAMKNDTKAAAKDTGKGVKTAAKDTEKGTKVAAKDTEKGTKVAAKDTAKAADKTGSAMKKGVKKIGGSKSDKPADVKTDDSAK